MVGVYDYCRVLGECSLYHHNDLSMKSAEVHSCFLYQKDEKRFVDGLIYLSVYDFMGASREALFQEEAFASKRFKTHTAEVLEDGC